MSAQERRAEKNLGTRLAGNVRMRALFSWKRLLTLFGIIAVASCTTVVLTIRMIVDTRGDIVLTSAIVIGNVLFLSAILLAVEALWHLVTIRRPIRRIIAGLERISHGDLSTRIEPIHKRPALEPGAEWRPNEFDLIIESVNQMAEELGSVESLRDDFVSNVSHELKTPLAAILNYATLLSDPGLSETERAEYLAQISGSARRLSELVANILRLNRLDNQRIQLKRDEFDLGEELCECFLPFETACEEKNLDVRVDLADGVVVRTDRELTSVVWTNLISNAIKFSEPGGVVEISLKSAGGAACVRVRDHGCGMDEKTLRHAFDKFYQGDTSHAVQGNGLGLALVGRIAELTGMTVDVKSELGKGTAFTATLPIGPAA